MSRPKSHRTTPIVLDPKILRAIVDVCDTRHVAPAEELTYSSTLKGGVDEGNVSQSPKASE